MSVKQKSHEQKNNKISEIDEQVLKLFDIKKKVGKGAYGIVWQATDKRTQQTVALKKIFDAFRNEIDAQRTFREVMFLKAFKNHPNIIELYSIHRAHNHLDIYLSFEYMESDLHNIIKRGSLLKDVHKRFIMYQLFNATQYIHSGNVIHRDMKPSNVLLDSKCRCKIADFGLARSLAQQSKRSSTISREPTEPCLTDYVATRWYRAPEILVASKRYTMGIDLWSLGCILGEMMRGKPLFPGSCTVNQMERIINALPDATDEDIASVGAGFGSALLSNQVPSIHSSLDDLLTGSPADASELIKSLLVLNPIKRLTAKEAMSHKYIEKFRNTCKEAELTIDIVPPFRDDVKLSVSDYRSKLYEMMSSNEKLNSIDLRDLDTTLTVTPCSQPNSKKTIFTKTSDPTRNEYETKPNQQIGDTKSYSTNLRKFQTKKLHSSNTQQNLRTNNNSMTNKKLTKTFSLSSDTISQQQKYNNDSNNFSTNNNNIIRSSCKLYRNSIGRDDSKEDDQNSGQKFAAIDRRNSIDNSTIIRTTAMFNRKSNNGNNYNNDGNSNKEHHQQQQLNDTNNNSKNKITNRFIDRNNNQTTTQSKYKIIKTLQNNQIKENAPKNKNAQIKSNNIQSTYYDAGLFKKNSPDTPNQMSDYYETKLKSIDDRIRKHKLQIKTATNLNDKIKISNNYVDPSKKKQFGMQSSNYSSIGGYGVGQGGQQYSKSKLCRTKSQTFQSDTLPLPMKMYSDANDLISNKYRVNHSHSNYGIISASDLFKLREP